MIIKRDRERERNGQTWLFQPLPVSTVPNIGRNQSDSDYRGLDEEYYVPVQWLTLTR